MALNLGQLDAVWQTTEAAGVKTLIPDGPQTAVLDGANLAEATGTAWFKWRFPEFDNRVLSVPINLTDRDGNINPTSFAILKGTLKNLGVDVDAITAGEIPAAMDAMHGLVAKVKLVTNTSKVSGKKYTNIYVNELVGREGDVSEGSPF